MYQDFYEDLAIHAKDLADVNAEEKVALRISALRPVVTGLGKHHNGASAQMPRGHPAGSASTIQYRMRKHAIAPQGVLTHTEREAMAY